ncbi:MAG: MBL fold metallo-hydrolase [Hyphomicrobiales bacterium]|nr:MBL fold metallo-hydrolase [Hyphomicrobiales bacterium]
MTQSTQNEFRVKFWGTRGSLATPDKQCGKAGGNTICVEVECGGHAIICDAGTGIRRLGDKILSEKKHYSINLLLSHAHYDHVEGIPFFGPMFSRDYTIEIWCGKLDGSANTFDIVSGFMRRPYFPVGPEVFTANSSFHEIVELQSFDISPEIHVKTIPLIHPGGATAYRIEFNDKSFAYVTDTEHLPGETNQQIEDFIQGADLFVYDASLTDDELPQFETFGHSTWQEGLRMAKRANVKRYFAFHHMPFRSDDELDQIELEISKELPGSGVARENGSILL